MTVTVSDLGSGVDTAAWMLSDTVFASQDAITGSWTDLSLTDGSGSFSIQPGQKGYAYLRVTDRAGNITVLNSDGVVVYTDAQADTRQITYVKRSGQDVSFHVALNGNTVTGVQLADGTPLADFIAAEDTRVSMKLLNHFDIKKPLVSYHEHNRAAAGQAILARLLAGETCALVTDAGTPAISDPGEDLVRLCGENSVTVQAIPGCCAAVCALAVSGLPTGRFTFEGFLSANKKERREALTRLAAEERTMVFHEAPHKLRPTLADMLELLGDRPVALCRELTKLHEETIRTTLSGAVALYREKEPRGEYVLVVAGAPRQEAPALTLAEGVAMVQSLRQQGQRMKDAVRRVAEDTGLSRNELYQAALQEE